VLEGVLVYFVPSRPYRPTRPARKPCRAKRYEGIVNTFVQLFRPYAPGLIVTVRNAQLRRAEQAMAQVVPQPVSRRQGVHAHVRRTAVYLKTHRGIG
jgi:hypothetical protein